MITKLTLTLEKETIEQAKKYAAENGKSLSEMVSNYFKYLTESRREETSEPFSPRIKKLKGILKVNPDFNYKKILEEGRDSKYGI